MKAVRFCRGAALALFAAVPCIAHAQVTIRPTAVWVNNTDNQATVLFDPTFSQGATTINYLPVYLGAEDLLVTDPATPVTRYDGYCIGITQAVQRPTFQANLLSMSAFPGGVPNGVPKGGAISWLYNNYAPVAYNSNRDSAALQLAIWEVEYDWTGGALGGINLTDGNFRYGSSVSGAVPTADILARATGMLTAWSGKQSDAIWVQPTNNAQPLVAGPAGSGQGVPEPGALSLFALGGLVFAVRAKRRRA